MFLSKKLVKFSEVSFQSVSYLGIVGAGLWALRGKCSFAAMFLLRAGERVVLIFNKFFLNVVLLHVSTKNCQLQVLPNLPSNSKLNFFTNIMSFHILLQAMDVTLCVSCIYINKLLNKIDR
jgi:hypothetical protein